MIVITAPFFLDYSYYYSGYYQAATEHALNTATEVQETPDMYPVTTESATASLQQSDEVTNMADTEVRGVYAHCAVTVGDYAVLLLHPLLKPLHVIC